MPRLRQVPRAEVDQGTGLRMYNLLFGDRDPVAEPGTATGTPGDWWTVFALVPDALHHACQGFGFYRSPKRLIDPVLRELGQTRAGWNKGSQFVFSQHCKSLRGLEVSEEKIESVAHWEVATCFDEKERAVLAYTDYLTLQNGRVPDPVFDKLKTFLSDEEILELTYITCLYDMHAVMNRALRLEYDDVDERVVEIAAPEGNGGVGRDFLDTGREDPTKTD
ncbi:MAG: carboxymuconolactone decarboxylase family protein [Caulobacter sp.]|jgi:alkylhydroperoxidase family enzyme|nr:carboxymuconolactone decarboxylase family protein [Caulobacter sp.]